MVCYLCLLIGYEIRGNVGVEFLIFILKIWCRLVMKDKLMIGLFFFCFFEIRCFFDLFKKNFVGLLLVFLFV